MPQYIYFDRFDVLDSAIHIPTFLSQIKNDSRAARVRTTECLFEHVGLDVSKLQALDSHQPGTPEQEVVRLRSMSDRSWHRRRGRQ